MNCRSGELFALQRVFNRLHFTWHMYIKRSRPELQRRILIILIISKLKSFLFCPYYKDVEGYFDFWEIFDDGLYSVLQFLNKSCRRKIILFTTLSKLDRIPTWRSEGRDKIIECQHENHLVEKKPSWKFHKNWCQKIAPRFFVPVESLTSKYFRGKFDETQS